MNPRRALLHAMISGSLASVASTAALALRGRTDAYAIHHAMSVFWAVPFEASRGLTRQRSSVRALGTATVACIVDYTITPRRLTPGFEKRLSKPSIALVYLAFAAGLMLGDAILRGKTK